jgi:hypothetical protein
MENILGINVTLNKYKKIEIISYFLWAQNKVKLNINSKTTYQNDTNKKVRCNNSPLNSQWIIEETG